MKNIFYESLAPFRSLFLGKNRQKHYILAFSYKKCVLKVPEMPKESKIHFRIMWVKKDLFIVEVSIASWF